MIDPVTIPRCSYAARLYSGDWLQEQVQKAVDAFDYDTLTELFELDVDQIAPFVVLAMLRRSQRVYGFQPRLDFVARNRARFSRIGLTPDLLDRFV